MNKIRIVSATRANADEFRQSSKLGLSIPRLQFDPRIVLDVAYCNSSGLPTVYNRAIQSSKPGEALLFVHDDVFIDDFNLFVRLEEALRAFDVVGVAGNIDPDPRHVNWLLLRDSQNKLRAHEQRVLSGVVGHFETNRLNICGYGLTPKPCVLLDGCLLAADGHLLRERQVQFDERFKFHFYDLDFCWTAISNDLRVGTWPIAVTHQSAGRFDSPDWEHALMLYRQKWMDAPTPNNC